MLVLIPRDPNNNNIDVKKHNKSLELLRDKVVKSIEYGGEYIIYDADDCNSAIIEMMDITAEAERKILPEVFGMLPEEVVFGKNVVPTYNDIVKIIKEYGCKTVEILGFDLEGQIVPISIYVKSMLPEAEVYVNTSYCDNNMDRITDLILDELESIKIKIMEDKSI